MSTDGTLGSMLQGVSQQPPAVRPDGKVSEQINFVSDVVQSLSARPALHERAVMANLSITDYEFLDVTLNDEHYIVGYKSGALVMWDLDGNEQTLTADAGTLDYIGGEMRPYVFEDKLYIANRDVVVEKSGIKDTSSVVLNTALISVLGGLYAKYYRISVRFDDGTTASAEYYTPEGNDLSDAFKTTSTYIAEQLYDNLIIQSEFTARGATASRHESVIYIHDAAGPMSVVVDDDDTQTALRAQTSTAESTADLAKTAPHGTLVEITGTDEGNEDNYWLRFNSKTTDTVGSGFGEEGVWEEWVNQDQVIDFDLSTMPHVIESDGSSGFTLKQGDWQSRRVGSNKTNPFPDFTGYPIRDIGGFQSRLVFVAGPNCCMSRTNEPTDFFKESVLTEVATDPINLTTTQEGTVRMDWIIPFDRDLVLMSDPGAGQFIITGSSQLTPDNASLVTTTAFEMKGGAKPVETGRTVMFPFKSGKFSGINEFFTNDEIATNGADTITETVDRYIVGLVNKMECSTNFNMAMFKTDDADYADHLWVYKYLWQKTEKLQSAWSKWIVPGTVRHFFFKESEVFVVLSEPGAVADTVNYIICSADLDSPIDPVAEFHICLDRQRNEVADASSTVTLPYSGAAFSQSTGCTTPGRPVGAESEVDHGDGTFTYTFLAEDVPEGATVTCGLRYTRTVKPTRPFARNRQGRPRPRTAVVVGSYILEYEETGYIKAIMESRYRTDPIEFVMDWFPMDNDPADPLGNGLRDGKLNIPWGERADWSELTITSDDVRPTTLIELEWTGQVFKGTRG